MYLGSGASRVKAEGWSSPLVRTAQGTPFGVTESCWVHGTFVFLLVLWMLAGGAWGQWVIVHDGNGVVASGVPDSLCQALQGVAQQNEPIKCVFLHQDGSWGIVSGHNRWQASLTPQFAELSSDVQSLQSGGYELRQVSVQPDGPGYAIVYGDKGVAARRVPQSLVNYLQPGIPGKRIGCLTLGPADHWFVSFDQGGYQSVAALTVLDAIKPLAAAYRRMDWVWYTNHQFGMIYESNGWTGLRIPSDLAQELNQLNARRSAIQVVAAPERGVGSASLRLQPNLAIASTPVLEVAKDVPAPANAFRRLVSQPYALTAGLPLEVTLPFDKASLAAGASVYPVLGRGAATVRLPGGRVNLEKGELSFRIEQNARVHLDGGADFRSSFFAAAVDAPGLKEVLPGKPDCSIWAEPRTFAKAQAAAPSFYRTLSDVRAKYAALGYRLPAHLDVYLVPLKGVRGVAGPQSLEFNLDVWADDDSSRATIAHELFHIVQATHGRGAHLNQITQVEGNWADEATAMFMGYRLFPKADTLWLWAQALDPEFLYRELMSFVPNSSGENPGYPAHQYLSFIFFRFLETLYDIDAVLQALYPTASPQTRPGSVHEVLENFVAGTPDRKGRTRPMSEVYVDFALSYAWHKDVSPLERASRLRKKHSLQLPPAGGPYHVGWNLPYDDGGQRRMSKSFRGNVGNYAISRAYSISSMTLEKKKEKGDLTIRVEGPAKIRLVVFPYSQHDGGADVRLQRHSGNLERLAQVGGSFDLGGASCRKFARELHPYGGYGNKEGASGGGLGALGLSRSAPPGRACWL